MTNTKIKVAVLLAVYNGMAWIEKQVDSILFQENIDLHIFISIDPSNDGSQEWCHKLATSNKQVTLLDTNEKYGSAAPNFFRLIRDVDFTFFDYIALADQDDIWKPSKLEKAISSLKKTNSAGYSSNVIAFWPNGREVLVKKSHPQVKWDYLFESPGPGCTFVLNKELALNLQNFLQINKKSVSAIWVHDWFIYAFTRANQYSWFIDENPLMLYRQHSNNEIGVNSGRKAIIHRIKFILSGKAMEQSSLIASLCGLENHPFVEKWHKHSRIGMLFLLTNARKCRRKSSHRVYFILSCLLLFITGKKSNL